MHGVHVTTLTVCKSLCGHIYSLLLGRYLGVELLGHMVDLCLTFSKDNLIDVFLSVLGLHCCVDFSLVVASRGCWLIAACRLLSALASLVAEHGLRDTAASMVVVCGLRGLLCSGA